MTATYCQKLLTISFLSLALLVGSSTTTLAQTSTSSQNVLELTKVNSQDVLPFMIFLETSVSKPKLEGTAGTNAVVTVEVNGEKNETKADTSGKWSWTPTKDLSGEVDLKISSLTESKMYRLIVKSSDTNTNNSATTTSSAETTSETPEDNIFEETPTEEVVTTPTPAPTNPLTAYLPFILGGLGIGILLLIISRILRPKNTVLSEVPPTTPLPINSMSGSNPAPSPASSWTPPTPELTPTPAPIATPSVPVTPAAEPVVPPPPPMPDFSMETPVTPATNPSAPASMAEPTTPLAEPTLASPTPLAESTPSETPAEPTETPKLS